MSGQRVEPSRLIDPAEISGRARYQLLTSLVVPRPIGWLSTWDEEGGANLAPYSFFNAFATSPMLVGVSIGQRSGRPKDTLVNIRHRGGFCVNVVSEPFLEAMNRTSEEVPPGVDEFGLAGLPRATSDRVDAPFVEGCPAVLECSARQEVDLGGAPNTLVIAEVVGVRLSPDLTFHDGTMSVLSEILRPVGRLSGSEYMLPGRARFLPRP
ncbi:MAG TPA: flavin reductase family protein [Longimicrobiales bacterium]|nr:flavin reductase family protein [Longimicrobiales bacterium]